MWVTDKNIRHRSSFQFICGHAEVNIGAAGKSRHASLGEDIIASQDWSIRILNERGVENSFGEL